MRKTSIACLLTSVMSLLTLGLNAQTTTGLQLWLKPEGLTNTVAASPITFWTDSSSGGYHATNTSGTQRPTLTTSALNGFPVAHFTGDGQISANLNWLHSPLPFNSAFTNFTAIIVYKATIPATLNPRLQLIHQVGGFANLYIPVTATTTNIKSDAGNFATAGVPITTGVWKIATVIEDAASVKIYENGGLIESKGIGSFTANSVSGWVFGARQDKTRFGFNGDIAEILVYTNSLSGAERAVTETYLASKYSLPATANLLTDDFNTVADPAGVNDDQALRQSGLFVPTFYTSGGGPVNITGGKINFDNTSPSGGYDYYYADPYINLLPYESGATIQISFDITNLVAACTNNQNDSWAAFSLSQYLTPGGPVTDWGLLIRTNGTGLVIDHPTGPLNFTGISVTPSNLYHVNLTLANGTVHLFINGADQGTSTVLCPLSFGNRYMQFGLGANANGTASVGFDNLAVTRTLAPQPALPSSLQLADNFNTADSADINANLARQTGPAAPSTWTTNGNLNSTLSISGNRLLMTNSPGGGVAIGMASPGADFRQLEHLNSFSMTYTVSGGNDATSNDSWLGLRFRDNAPSHFVADADGGGSGINFFSGDGRWFFWQSYLGATNTSAIVASGTVPVAGSYDFEVEVRNNILRMKINGLQLSLGCGDGTYTLPASQTANYVTLHCFAGAPATAGYAAFDNFQFKSLDPGFTIPPPTIINPSSVLGGTAFALSVVSSNNIFYAVDAKADLTAAAWNYLGGVVGNGGTVSYTNNPATNGMQFYRLRVP